MTNAIELAVTLYITFQTNCFVNGGSADGTHSALCVVERVCRVDHDLGDGHRLMLCVTNEIMRYGKSFKVRTRKHPILGVTEEEVSLENAPPLPPLPSPPA